jgi:threonine/homoserine/homoserine lactone efflux protein
MVSSFIEGLVAGFGIAIPFGPISVLIIETSVRNGLRHGLAAGMGAASVDFIFAAISAIAGTAVASEIAPYSNSVRLLSAFFLIALGLWGLRKIVRPTPSEKIHFKSAANLFKTYITFFALTALNPITVAYFTALILRKNPDEALHSGELLLFILGAGIASLSWQSFLAAIGFNLEKKFSANFQKVVSVIGNVVILGFGVNTILHFLNS